MQQQIHITPDQIPALLAQNREQLAALNEVIENKTRSTTLLDEMGTCLVNKDIFMALAHFVDIQKIEYTQQLRALHAQQSQVQSLIHQLENPVSIPTMGAIPPPPGSGKRQDLPFNPNRR